MAFGFSRTRVSPIAIDFGADSLKLLQIVPGETLQLQAAGLAVLPEAARQDPLAREQFLESALGDLLRRGPFKNRRVICSIPAFQMLVQNLEINGSDTEAGAVAEQVASQLRQRMNVEPARMVVRHFPVGQVIRHGSTVQQVLCLAAPRETVMSYIRLCHRLKLDVVGMHGEPLAIMRAFEHLGAAASAEQALCYIDIGAMTTKVVIAHGQRIVFAKAIPAAGDQMTRRLAAARHVSFDQARALRIAEQGAEAPKAVPSPVAASAGADERTGLPALDSQHAAAPPRQLLDMDEPAEADTLECVTDELQMCLRYYRGMFPNRPVEKLIFLGGESKQVSTCRTIARAVGVAAQLGDPLAGLARPEQASPGVDLAKPQPGWAVPLGLCLSEANL